MRAEEFIEKYGHKYEYNWDEYDSDKISLFMNRETGVDLGHVVIEFFYDEYSIYRKFLYIDQHGPALNLNVSRDELLFKESVKRVFRKEAQTDIHLGYGCPFYSDIVGFIDMPFSWEDLNQMLVTMEQACLLMKKLNLSNVDHTSKDYVTYMKEQENLLEEVKELAPELCYTRLKDSFLNHEDQFNSICAFVNKDATIITGVGTDDILRLTGGFSSEKILFYFGYQYFVVRDEKLGIAITKQKEVDHVLDIFQSFDEEEYGITIKFSLNQRFRIAISYGALWAIVLSTEEEHHEFCLIHEKNSLKARQQQFFSIAPKGLWQRNCDFSKLDDTQFEHLCRDLLAAKGFQNIHLRGSTHTPDGGVDITAEEEYKTNLGLEKRIWIFQCKHTKHQIDRKDISEVPDLLTEFHADCYGLFYSGIFSPSTLNRIDGISRNRKTRITRWDSNDLELLLNEYPKIYARYFGF